MARQAAVPTAVMAQTKNQRLRESMMLGAGLEGGWNPPFPVGDQGTSFGPYQMHEGGMLTSLGLTPAQAENANTATKYMLPTYSQAVNQISEQEWKNNPEQAAEQSAVIAEGPAQDYYTTDGAQGVNKVWTDTQGALKGKKSTSGMPAISAQTTSATGDLNALLQLGQGNILGAITSLFTGGKGNVTDWFERGGLIILGGILIIVGIVIFAVPAARKAASIAATSNRGLSAAQNLGGAEAKDTARRQAIADRSLAIGEMNARTKATREARLARKP